MDPRAALKSWRLRKGLTQAAAAKQLGCGKDMYKLVERGERYPGRRLANSIKAKAGVPQEAWDRLEDDEHDDSTVRRPRAAGEASR